ncbi:MAG TPA: MBL fold metallo-hydrolase [Candidatus Paceibacterota bacterium]
MKLTFYGGVKEVTGSNYVVEHDGVKIMIDCGLIQGGYFSEERNWEPFAYNPKEIAAVFLTHAHIDHSGRLPKLVKNGFRGKVYSTPPTRDFANLLLLDSEHVMLQAAERLKKQPLYTILDIEQLMTLWEGMPYHQPLIIGPFKITLFKSAHILGSAMVLVEAGNRNLLFTGDLGNSPAPLLGVPDTLENHNVDYCVVESAYGDRIHPPEKVGVIEDLIENTFKAGGVLMIPAFAMERTQKLLFEINELVENNRVPRVPIFLDSPLAIKITEVYKRYKDYFDKATLKLLKGEDHMLFDFPGLKKTLTTEESRAILAVKPPKVIIAGSGMSQGGRILHHEKNYLPDPNSAIIFIGYQAKGSLGRRIQEGVATVTIHGETVLVRCHILSVEGYSAHADQKQILEWLAPMRFTLKQVFAVQGEEDQSQALAHRVVNDLAIRAEIPEIGKSYEL